MVALRSPRRPPEAPAAPAEPVVAPVEPTAVTPPSDSPMLDNLKAARDSVPFPPGQDANALQAQLAAVQQAEAAQREAFEQQRQIAAAMQIERQQPKEPPQLSERDLQFLGARPGIQSDPTFSQSIAALAHVYQYGSDDFYKAMEMKYPVSNFRRVEPKQHEDSPPPRIVEREEPKPSRRVVTSAPVSRNESGAPSSYTPSPSSVKLSPAEREIAAGAGMSDADYARNKLRLAKLKESGFYNES